MSQQQPVNTEELAALVDALRRKVNTLSNELEDTREQNQELRERIADLENIVDPDPGATDYQQLTKDQKVWRVRKKLAHKAAEERGSAAMQYKDIYWLFDGHPSAGHCYDLMQRAADADGFDYGTNEEGDKRITVKLDGVNDERLIHAVKKGYHSEAA